MSDEVLGRLNTSAWRAVDQAQAEARRLKHSHIRTEHILLGLLLSEESVAVRTLRQLGIEPDALRQQVEKAIGPGDRDPSGTIPFTPQAEKALELARREALRLRHENIGSEHLLLGLMNEGVGDAGQVLSGIGADQDRVRDEAVQIRMKAKTSLDVSVPPGDSAPSVLEYFAENVTRQASQGSLAPVIGRDREIKGVMDVLAHPTTINPILIGGTSAARTAVIEGLAQAIAKGEGPEISRNKQLYAFSPAALARSGRVSGLQDPQLRIRILELCDRLDLTAHPAAPGGQGTAVAAARPSGKLLGERPARDPHGKLIALDVVAAVLEESRSRRDIILFIDELPQVAGGAVPEGELDITPILKPLLAAGKLQIIGAGAADDYHNSWHGDNDLWPFLQPVQITEYRIMYTIGMLEVAMRAATRVRNPAG